MSSSSGSAKFQCPKCLTQISFRADQLGKEIQCPNCNASLKIPDSLGDGGLFDDLFDDDPRTELEDNMPTMSDESELDTGFLEELNMISLESEAAESEPTPTDKDNPPKPPAFKGDYRDAGKDPFDYDENQALRIEGISEDVAAPNSFYFKCPICDSELRVLDSQIGQQVKCADCHAEVKVKRPKKKPKQDNWRNPAVIKSSDSDDDIKLEPPVERPPIDPSFGLKKVEDDLLAPRQPQEPDSASNTESERGQNPANPNVGLDRNRRSTHKKKPVQNPSAAAPSSTQLPPDTKPVNWNQLSELQWIQDLDLLMRSIVATVFLGLGYSMFDFVWNTLGRSDMNGGEKFVAYFPALLGFLACMMVVFWFLSVTFSVVMRSVANGFNRIEEWVGFAPSEWLGSFIVVVVSCWAALLPGVMLGFFMYKLTGFFLLFPMLAAISAFALMPVMLISSFYNESAFNIFAPDVLQTLTTKSDHWIAAYKMFGISLGIFVAGLILLLIPGIVFSMLGAAVQVAAVTVLSALTGLHARTIVGPMR